MGQTYVPYTTDRHRHAFELQSAYAAIGELQVTNYTPSFNDRIDYIRYGTENLEVTRHESRKYAINAGVPPFCKLARIEVWSGFPSTPSISSW
jgi:mRNA deadenylase 3'-5' endonuclease subunit Ccr4